jgi:hypothetical protein
MGILVKNPKSGEIHELDVDESMQTDLNAGDTPETATKRVARDKGYQILAEVVNPKSGESHLIDEQELGAAEKKGYKHKMVWDAEKAPEPAPYGKHPSAWESAQIGAGRSYQAVVGPSVMGELPRTESTPIEDVAYAEHPIAYGAGRVGGLVGMAGAVLGAGYAGTKVTKALVNSPLVQGMKAGAKAGISNPGVLGVIPLGLDKPVAAVTGAIGGAKDFLHENRGLKNLVNLGNERGAVGPKPEFPLAAAILEPGTSPIKQALAERAVTIAPSALKVDPLNKALEMGTERRATARNFQPIEASREITPRLRESLKNLRDRNSTVFEKLNAEAQGQYEPQMGAHIPEQLAARINSVKDVKGISSVAKNTMAEVNQIISEGPEGLGLVPGEWNSLSPADQFSRLQKAKTTLGDRIRALSKSNDPTMNDRTSINHLKELNGEIDDVLKQLPAKKEADRLYSEGKQAKEGFFDAMEFGQGVKRSIDESTVERLFGNNPKAKRLEEGISKMRDYLTKNGDVILPETKDRMMSLVNRFDELRKVAEDKRILEGIRQAQGPTSPAIERTEALRIGKGLPQKIYETPAGSINAVDEFIASRATREFGKPYGQLTQPEKNKLTQMLIWRQQNPNATIENEQSIFKKIKGK